MRFVKLSDNCTLESIHLICPLLRRRSSLTIARPIAVRLSSNAAAVFVGLDSASYIDFASVITANARLDTPCSQLVDLLIVLGENASSSAKRNQHAAEVASETP